MNHRQLVEHSLVRDNVAIREWNVDPRTGLHTLSRSWTTHNLVVNSGYDLLASLLNNESNGVSHFAVGTGANTPTLSNAALQTEVFREALTDITHSSGSGLVTFTHYLSSGSANGNTLREIGLFADPTVGPMYARSLVSPVIVKDATKAVTFSWTTGFGSGSTLTITRQTGYLIYLDGNRDVFIIGNAYPSGGTYAAIVPSSTTWYLLPSDLPVGTFALEASVRVDNAAAQVTIALFNLDDAPDTPLAGSTVSGTVGQMAGERIRSGSISLGSPASAKNYAMKMKTNNAAYGCAVWGGRIIQTS